MTIPDIKSYEMPKPGSWQASKVAWALDPARAALLIHDMQDYFLDYYGDDSPLKRTLVDHVRRLKAACTAMDIPVIYTAQPVGQEPEQRGLLNDMWGPGIDRRPDRRDIVSALTPSEGDTVLTKWRYSAFQKSDFADVLKDRSRDQLIICGIYGHIGCLMTAAHAFMLDIKPFVVGDAIADFSLEEHRMTLSYVAGRCGRVIGLEDVENARERTC